MSALNNVRWALRQRIGLMLLAAVAAATPAATAQPVPGGAGNVVIVVSAASSVTEITQLHLADLYMGRTTRFPNGAPAVAVDQRSGTTDRVTFSEEFLGRSEAQVKAHWSKLIFTGRGRPPVEVAGGEAVRNMVASNPQAIGYMDRRLVNSTVRVVRVR